MARLKKEAARREIEPIKSKYHDLDAVRDHELTKGSSAYTSEIASLREKLEEGKRSLPVKAVQSGKSHSKLEQGSTPFSEQIAAPSRISPLARPVRSDTKQQQKNTNKPSPASEQNNDGEDGEFQLVERPKSGKHRGLDLKPIDTATANSVPWAEQQRLMDSDESKSPQSAGTTGSRHSWHSTGLLAAADPPKTEKWHRLTSYFGVRRHSERHRRSEEPGEPTVGHRKGRSESTAQASVEQNKQPRLESSRVSNQADRATPNRESSVLRLRPSPDDRDKMRFGGRGTGSSSRESRQGNELGTSEAKGILLEKPNSKPQLIGLSDDPGPAQKRPATVSFGKQKKAQPRPVGSSDDPGLTQKLPADVSVVKKEHAQLQSMGFGQDPGPAQKRPASVSFEKTQTQPQAVGSTDHSSPGQRPPATGVPRRSETKHETKSGWEARSEKSRSLAERQSYAMVGAGK